MNPIRKSRPRLARRPAWKPGQPVWAITRYTLGRRPVWAPGTVTACEPDHPSGTWRLTVEHPGDPPRRVTYPLDRRGRSPVLTREQPSQPPP